VRNPREPGFQEVRDRETGRFIVRFNPATGELTRPDGGRILRGQLTERRPIADNPSEREPPRE
jgi:hypothetical protein